MSSRSLDLFFQACEVARLPGLSVSGEPAPRQMGAPFAVVGSDPRCDLVLDDETVRPRHGYLQAIGPKVLCVELGSPYGTGSGRGPAPACWIDRDQEIQIGSRVIQLAPDRAEPSRPDPAPGGPVAERPLLSHPMPRIALDFRTNHIRTHWRMRRAVALVGTAPECTVRLNGAGVSRYHCALVLTGQGLWAVDLLGVLDFPGEGATFVNGTPVRFARVDPGDVLRVGAVSVGVRHVTAPARRVRPLTPEAFDAGATISEGTEAAGKDVADDPVTTSDLDIEALHRDYEDQIAEQAEQHRVEVESLRDEIEELLGRLERLRSASGPKRRRGCGRKPDRLPSPTEGFWPRRISIRTLGSATRRIRSDSHSPPERVLAAGSSPETYPDVLSLAGPGLVSLGLAGRISSAVS